MCVNLFCTKCTILIFVCFSHFKKKQQLISKGKRVNANIIRRTAAYQNATRDLQLLRIVWPLSVKNELKCWLYWVFLNVSLNENLIGTRSKREVLSLPEIDGWKLFLTTILAWHAFFDLKFTSLLRRYWLLISGCDFKIEFWTLQKKHTLGFELLVGVFLELCKIFALSNAGARSLYLRLKIQLFFESTWSLHLCFCMLM